VEKNNPNQLEQEYWMHFLHSMLSGDIDTWDFQVQFANWKTNSLTVTPGRNLVENRGFRPDATHTQTDLSLGKRKAGSIPGPYPRQPFGQNQQVDHVTFLQRLFVSPEFASHLMLKNSKEVEWLRKCAASAEASKQLAESKEPLPVLCGENEAVLEQLDIARGELKKYYGFTGALRCLRKIFYRHRRLDVRR